jgi:endonuclease/exonuclease/phosphatase family metal-dependent hydrolase
MEKHYSVMSLNVHDFNNAEMENSLENVKNLIKGYDVIALQEVYDKEKLKEIVKGYNYAYNKGTLLMTKFPFQEINYHISNEAFTAFILIIPLHVNVLVTNIHLNYEREDIRLKELDNILKKINKYYDDYPIILLGDFNSLTRKDYTQKGWADIHKIRKNGLWELPTSKLTDKLNIHWFDSGQDHKGPTSRYDTRIDYIFTKCLFVSEYDMIKTIPNISDHNLISIKFL